MANKSDEIFWVSKASPGGKVDKIPFLSSTLKKLDEKKEANSLIPKVPLLPPTVPDPIEKTTEKPLPIIEESEPSNDAPEQPKQPLAEEDNSPEEPLPREVKELSPREELIKRISDSVKYFAGFGKTHSLAGTRAHIDFADLYYFRTPTQETEPSTFSVDKYDPPLRALGGNIRIDSIHKTGVNNWIRPPEGEVTLRYLNIIHENNQAGLIVILSMVNGTHPFDRRWNGHADYFAFDLPFDEGKQFIEESLKDPQFTQDVLEKITEQRKILSSYTQPQYLVCATQPGISPFKVAQGRESSSRGSQYSGSFIVSQGSDENQSLESLGINLEGKPQLRLDRKASDSRYESYHSIPANVQEALTQAQDFKTIRRIIESIDEKHQFTEELQYSLRGIDTVIAEFAEKWQHRPASKEEADEWFNKLITKIPEKFDIRDKVKEGLRTVFDSILQMYSLTSSVQETVEALKKLSSITEEVYFVWGRTNVKSLLQQIERALALENQPIKLVEYLTDRRSENQMSSVLTIGCNLDAKIFLASFKHWNFIQKPRVLGFLKNHSDEARGLISNIGEIDQAFFQEHKLKSE